MKELGAFIIRSIPVLQTCWPGFATDPATLQVLMVWFQPAALMISLTTMISS